MRFRLGLLQDTAAIEKQIAKDAAEAKKAPTVKTEAQAKADEARAKEPDKSKEKKKPKIRPLSEAKAIDLGANFVSETFLLAVGISLILFENARKGRQEANRREDVADQIEELQKMNRLQRKSLVEVDKELMVLRSKTGVSPGTNHSLLPKELRELEESEEQDEEKRAQGWISWAQGFFQSKTSKVESPEPATVNALGPAKEVDTTSPAPAAAASMLSKILPRSHPRDLDPRIGDEPVEANSTKLPNTADGNPEDAESRTRKEQ